MQLNAGARSWRGRWGPLVPRALAAIVLVSVPCLALLGFGPGLAQVLSAEVWASESVSLAQPAAAADLVPASAPSNEVVFLANWEATDCMDYHHHHHHGTGGSSGSSGSIPQAIADIADAQVQTQTALGLVNAAITLLGSTNAKNDAQAFADLRQAGIDEQRAATDLSNATTQATKANQLTLANALLPLAGQMSSIATQVTLAAQIAQQLDPAAPAQSYVIGTILPLANNGVSTANSAANAISPYQP